MFRIAYPYEPDELDALHPPFVQDLLEIRDQNQRQALSEISKMIAALKSLGLDCGFTKKMFNSPLYELKTHSRAECKDSNQPDPELLESAALILLAFKTGKPVFPARMKNPIQKNGEKL
jgi:hypothetical protein